MGKTSKIELYFDPPLDEIQVGEYAENV